MAKIQVGVVGTGFIGPAHVEALRRLGNVNVAAIADVDAATAKQKAEELGIERHFGDYRELLRERDIQSVHVCTPNHLHFTMVKEALEAGKHVICEKPLAVDVAQAEELTALAEKKGVINAVHFNVRFYPLMRQVKLMVEKGDLGRIFAIHGTYLQDWLFYDTDYNWRLEPEMAGTSRAVADIGSHWMDLIEYVSGLKVVEVLADFATFHKTRQKPKKAVETYTGKLLTSNDYEPRSINTEDYATVMMRFEKEARGVMTVSQVSAGRKNRIYFQMDGSKKSVWWDSEDPNRLWIGRRDGNNELMLKDPSLVYPEARGLISFPGGHNEAFPDTSKQMFKEIYRRIAGQTSEPVQYPTFKDGLRELQLCDAIVKSNASAGWKQVVSE